MIELLAQPLWGIVLFLSVALLISISNLAGIRRLRSTAPLHIGAGAGPAPFVSILVPARNEERSIEACTRSLLAQDYEPFEVIVLDDQSTDLTPSILKDLAEENLRLKLLAGAPLPTGWVGKPWACHQLAEAARGDLVLFTDADTRHHPGMLAGAVSALSASGADLISGFPEQEAGTWGERLLLPMLSWVIFALVPIPLARRLRLPGLSAAVGQFMLFKRDAYDQIGGHTSVRSTSTEDLALARLVKAHGLQWDFVHLNGLVTCRMYHGFREAYQGISKNLLAVFNNHTLAYGFAWLWLVYAFTLPVLALALPAAGISRPIFDPTPAWLAAGLSLLLWITNNLYFGMPLVQAPLYPVTVLLYGSMAARTGWYALTGRSQTWKGRSLPARNSEVDR